jgi:TRAP-type mannitol/chloroaromatic compound transport system permease large subunit
VIKSWAGLRNFARRAGSPDCFFARQCSGVSLSFAILGSLLDVFDFNLLLGAVPSRFIGVMTNEVLVAVPLFVFMGVLLERSRIAEQLLETMGLMFGRLRGGFGIWVIAVGTVLAASTGIVG